MKHFRLTVRLIEGLGLLVSLFFFFKAPDQITMHFNGNGTSDATGSRWLIFLEEVLLVIVGEGGILYATHFRKQRELTELSRILPNEWSLIVVVAAVLVLFSVLMGQQIGLSI